ncbi:MAG: hypothetical protein ACR2LL_09625 [Nitrosopumilus sp.]
MNKHTLVVIIASVVIAISVGFSGWNIFASEQVDLMITEEHFSYFGLMNSGKISVCNPLPFYANFNEIRISMIFDERSIGVLSFSEIQLEPNSEVEVQGTFTSENFKEAQYLSLHFDSMYNDVIPTRIDQEKMNVVTEIQTNIIGVIPYSVTNQYPGLEFWNVMEDREDYSCQSN